MNKVRQGVQNISGSTINYVPTNSIGMNPVLSKLLLDVAGSVAVLLNGIMVYLFSTTVSMRKDTNLFMYNLCITNLFVGLNAIFQGIVYEMDGFDHESSKIQIRMLKIAFAVRTFLYINSLLHVTTMVLSKLNKIMFPTKEKSTKTPKKFIYYILTSNWIISLLIFCMTILLGTLTNHIEEFYGCLVTTSFFVSFIIMTLKYVASFKKVFEQIGKVKSGLLRMLSNPLAQIRILITEITNIGDTSSPDDCHLLSVDEDQPIFRRNSQPALPISGEHFLPAAAADPLPSLSIRVPPAPGISGLRMKSAFSKRKSSVQIEICFDDVSDEHPFSRRRSSTFPLMSRYLTRNEKDLGRRYSVKFVLDDQEALELYTNSKTIRCIEDTTISGSNFGTNVCRRKSVCEVVLKSAEDSGTPSDHGEGGNTAAKEHLLQVPAEMPHLNEKGMGMKRIRKGRVRQGTFLSIPEEDCMPDDKRPDVSDPMLKISSEEPDRGSISNITSNHNEKTFDSTMSRLLPNLQPQESFLAKLDNRIALSDKKSGVDSALARNLSESAASHKEERDSDIDKVDSSEKSARKDTLKPRIVLTSVDNISVALDEEKSVLSFIREQFKKRKTEIKEMVGFLKGRFVAGFEEDEVGIVNEKTEIDALTEIDIPDGTKSENNKSKDNPSSTSQANSRNSPASQEGSSTLSVSCDQNSETKSDRAAAHMVKGNPIRKFLISKTTKLKMDLRSLLCSLAVSLAFVVTWLPKSVRAFGYLSNNPILSSSLLNTVADIIVANGAVFNTLIYVITNDDLRLDVKKRLLQIFCCEKSREDNDRLIDNCDVL